MTCLGRCHENSAFHFQGKNYSGDAIKDLSGILADKANLNIDTYNVADNGTQILTTPFHQC